MDEFLASPAHANSCAKCLRQMENVSAENHVTLRTPNTRPGNVQTNATSNGIQRSQQRRWSGDASPVITVMKRKQEPQPPQRGVSVLQPHAAASQNPNKRYSCPPIGVSRLSSSSSSSSSSCSSPPPTVQTSVITGHDPRGWKLRPKSSSRRVRVNRLSLQIQLPVFLPGPAANPDPAPKTPPPPKPPRRRHSDSSAFLVSPVTPQPVVTLEDLCTTNLRSLALLDESDSVFDEADDKEVKASARTGRKPAPPPPVPQKTARARHIARLLSQAYQRQGADNEEVVYASVMKLKAKRSENQSSMNARITGLHVDSGCDRERSKPRVPG